MDIRRQYSLPNCTLVLEGYSDSSSAATHMDARPLMSILVNAECHFAGNHKPLAGGRDFFESLVTAVSSYAQEFLSGMPHQALEKDKPDGVQLQKLEGQNLHRLMVKPASSQGQQNYTPGVLSPEGAFIDLTTVQLFDLVDAVDQFLADTRTLPDLSLHLTPVSKRYAAAKEPLVKRATPAAVGVTSLAVAAIAFSLVPVPKQSPKAEPQANASATPSPESSTQATPSPSPPTPSATPELEALMNSQPEITEARQLNFLQRKLLKNIDQAWPTRQKFGEQLVYKVGVGEDGAIVGYKPENEAARNRIKETPLPDLLYKSIQTPGRISKKEPIANFKVVFTERGVPQVSPWNGYKAQSSLGPEIKDLGQLRELSRGLYEQLSKNWQGTRSYKSDLKYRVAVTKDGAIADYEPKNQPAFDYEEEIPLPELLKSSNPTGKLPSEPLAQFQVVFKPNGRLEVGPLPGNR